MTNAILLKTFWSKVVNPTATGIVPQNIKALVVLDIGKHNLEKPALYHFKTPESSTKG